MAHSASSLWLPVVIALTSLILSAYAGYSHNDKAISERITTVETQQKNDGQRLERMEDKLDRIYELVR